MPVYRPHEPARSIALRYRIGIAGTLLLAALMAAAPASAQGLLSTAPPPLTTLVKFDDRPYEISYSETVSLEPISSTTVRKIGYGYERSVGIATTSSGTYSTDGMMSPHVSYPGISVAPVRETTSTGQPIRTGPGYSIFSIGRSPNGGVVLNNVNDLGVRSCIMRGSFLSCYRTY